MNPHTPLVSIVIPCHNCGRYLEAAIDSCLYSKEKLAKLNRIWKKGGRTGEKHHFVRR